MNVKLPFSGGGIDLAPGLPESVRVLRVGIYQYECQIAIFLGGGA